MPTARQVLRKLYRTSPEGAVKLVGQRVRRSNGTGGDAAISVEFLRSPEYHELMMRHVPCDGDYGLHEAQTATKSFMFRHFKVQGWLGTYRWRGVQQHLDLIIEHVADRGGLVVDLGGAAAPFGLGSVVVDTLTRDSTGAPVPYASLDDLPGKARTIVSSHTLEHIPQLDAELARISDSLEPGGHLLALLPSYYCERWRVGTHSHADFGDHVWTFGLSGSSDLPEGLINYVEVDRVLDRHLEVDFARYVGDDSILALCRRR